MSRQKIIRIHAAELKCWEELSDHPLFQDANFDKIEIVSMMHRRVRIRG